MLTATNRSNIKISREIELKRFSEKTSKFIKKFKTIFLYGELGVGKTTFVKHLINNLQKKETMLMQVWSLKIPLAKLKIQMEQ